jgi:hypothetical protein
MPLDWRLREEPQRERIAIYSLSDNRRSFLVLADSSISDQGDGKSPGNATEADNR